MCAFGMQDPSGYYYYKPTSLLHNFGEGVLDPVFKRCTNKLGGAQHIHQPLEGNVTGYGSRTKLAQVYPYRFCSVLIRAFLPLGKLKSLLSAQSNVVIDLLEQFSIEHLQDIEKEVYSTQADSEHVLLSASDAVKQSHTWPVRDYYTKRALNMINALPVGYEYNPFAVELHHDIAHLRQQYLSTMPFDKATIFRGTFQPLRVHRQTNDMLILWNKKITNGIQMVHFLPSRCRSLTANPSTLECHSVIEQ